jgi:hypothetical protein
MTFCQFEIANPETVFVWVGKWIARVDPNKERVGVIPPSRRVPRRGFLGIWRNTNCAVWRFRHQRSAQQECE